MYSFVEGIGNHIGGVFAKLVILAVLGLIALACWVGYGAYTLFSGDDEVIIESHTRLTPEIKLHTDGKSVDTIYVYKQTK